MGRLFEYVVAHEVGHTLGFQHNMKASSMYPVEQGARPRSGSSRMGHTPTIMDYSRFNYVAQPEDKHRPSADLIPKIGPYDMWATKWGYTPIRAQDAGRREEDARQVGARAGRDAVASLLDRRIGRLRSRAS